MTRFKNLPLFGPDSSPQNTSEKLGLIGTAVVWLILTICFAVIKPAQKTQKYKEVQIVLSNTPAEKRAEEAPAPAAPAPAPSAAETVASEVVEAAAPVVESKPAPVEAPKPVEKKAEPKTAAKAVEKPKTEPKKAETKPAEAKPAAKPVAKKEPEPVQTYKSVEELMEEQFTAKKTARTADDVFAQMDADSDYEETTSTQKVVQNTTPAFSGSAATATKASKEPVKSASTAKTTNQNTSNATSNALGKITNAKFFGTASSSVDTEANVQTTASGNGKVTMVMSNGSSRVLLEPAKPIINLTEQAAATIDGSRKVSITFTVTESGNVPRGEISITPESILSEIVRKEIRDQISKWRFESADYISTAVFEYKIVKYND